MRTLLAGVASALSCMLAYGQTVEWTYEVEGGAAAPTLFPTAEKPTGVVIAAGKALLRFNGTGEVIVKRDQEDNFATPVTVADLDGDGTYELLFALANGAVRCANDQGEPRWTRQYRTDVGGFKNLVAADVHPSPGLEVLFGFDDGWLRCLDAHGRTLWEFYGDRFRVGGVSVGDVDGDGAPEVVYGTDNGHIYCLNGWGEVEWRFEELAPYGRSGTNISDLDSNGMAEILVTRSNVNNNTCLIAISGVDGSLLWRTKDVMQGYVSNAVADFDGTGAYSVLHADKGNHVYCENPDGTRRWQAVLGGRGIFWAPAVADIDGDGYLEVVTGTRGEDPETGACVYVLGQDGTIDGALDLGNDANAGPAIGDIDGDGELEVIVITQGPSQIQVLTWHGAGRVGWPSLRGNSGMTAKTPNVPEGIPGPAPLHEDVGEVRVESGPAVWGENRWRLAWNDPAPRGSFIELAAITKRGARTARIIDVKPGATETDVVWDLAGHRKSTVRARLMQPGSRQPLFVVSRAVKPLAPDYCDFPAVQAACRQAIEAGNAVGADTSGIAAKLGQLDTSRNAVAARAQSEASDTEVAVRATALREQARQLNAMANLLEDFWRQGGSGTFVVWEDPNPWDSFDPAAVPEALDLTWNRPARPETDSRATPLALAAYKNELEDKALTLFNPTSQPIDVRCVFRKPDLGQNWYKPEDPLAQNVTLRRLVPVPSAWADRVFDALPELDLSRSITIPPGEGRQLWLVLRTHNLEPGAHDLTLYLGSLTKPATIREIPIRIEVWPVALPTDIYAKIGWCGIHPDSVSDQALAYMMDHGLSVVYGPPLPPVPVDRHGRLSGTIDWREFDSILDRAPKHWTFLWGGPPTRKWPEGIKPDEDSPEYFTGFQTAIRELANHMKRKGFDYYHWAFYPVDEPWNTGFTSIPYLKRFCEMVKRADPRAQVYTDPAGLVRVEYLEEFKGLIDIWQPEVNTLKRDPQLVEWFQRNAKRFWFYEAPGPGKNLLPLGHYRTYGWFAWHFGTEGSGYWVYKALDIWWPILSGDWSAVYQTNADIIASRRSEADRDGVEDYRAFYVLNREIERARQAGYAAQAEEAHGLIRQAFDEVVGWQIGTIDEITRVTRDYELDYTLLLRYRLAIRDAILRLRALPDKPTS